MSSTNGSSDAPADAAALYPDDDSGTPRSTPWDHIQALWQGKWFILSLALLLGGAAYVYQQNQPRQYRASTALLLNEPDRPDRMTKFLPVQAPNRIGRELYFLRNSEVFAEEVARELLTHADTLSAPAESSLLWRQDGRLRSPEALAARLSGAVSVRRDAQDLPALRIQATGPRADEAALVANTYADVYRVHRKRSSNAQVRATRQLLKEQKRKLHTQLRALEDSISTRVRSSRQRGLLAPTDSGGGLVGKANQLAGKIAELRHKKEEVQLDLQMEQALLDSARARLRRIRPNLADRASSTTSTRLQKTQEEMASLKSEIRLIKARNRTLSPQLQAQLSDMKARLDTLQTRADRLATEYVDRSLSTGAIRPLDGESGGGLASVVDLRRQITKRRLSVTRLSAKLKALDDRLEQHRAALRDSPNDMLSRLRRRKATTQELFVSLSKNLQRTRVSATASPEQVEILRPAAPPSTPIAPDVWSNVILATLLGGVAAGGGTLLYNRFDDVIEAPEDLPHSSSGPFGTIPEWSATTDPAFDESAVPWPGIADPFAPAVEAYRHLATNIRLGLPRNVSTIVVISPGAKEGKTTTAANLAVAFTEAGQDVLLVDADLQGPALHRLFNADRTPGLPDQLSDEHDAVQSLPLPTSRRPGGNGASADAASSQAASPLAPDMGQLGLLAAGHDVPQPSLLLQERHLRPLLEPMQASWDLVLIDTPPALLYDDAFRLASLSELTLLLAAAHRTRRRAVQDVRTRLDDLCSHTIAEVLNRDSSASPSRYGYTSSYYPSRRSDVPMTDRLAQTVSRGVRRVLKG
ncbi:MAG: hypothetical protein BRD55_05715 [Bacteroidetes bacterium SW_9_63_38]|nr:MAG: hypothetical protein BRD55_05715 [Bacteroidetes bacterium SW_9_63_38]